jgi:cytochrome c-type biogenesis protein CcmH/NrfF
VLVWFKSPSRGVWWSMRPAVDRLGLVRLGETDLAHVWLNPSGGRKVVVSPPLVPLWVATVLLLVVTAGIFWDVLRRRRGISSS